MSTSTPSAPRRSPTTRLSLDRPSSASPRLPSRSQRWRLCHWSRTGCCAWTSPSRTCCRSSLIGGCCALSTANSMTRLPRSDPSRSRICSASDSGSDRSWRRPAPTPFNERRPRSACRASAVRRGHPWRTTSMGGWRPSARCRSCINRANGGSTTRRPKCSACCWPERRAKTSTRCCANASSSRLPCAIPASPCQVIN